MKTVYRASDGTEFDSEQECKDHDERHAPWTICVLQRGHVIVGRARENGDYFEVSSASVIRVWGTTGGLPELAESGPLEKTKLDGTAYIRFHKLTSVMLIRCNQGAWQ